MTINVKTKEEVEGITRTRVEVVIHRSDVHFYDPITRANVAYTVTDGYRIVSGTGESSDDKARKDSPVTYNLAKYVRKAVIDNPLGTGHYMQALAGEDFETGEKLSGKNRAWETIDGAVSSLGVAFGGNASLGLWASDFSVEQLTPILMAKFDLENSSQAVIFTYYVGKMIAEGSAGKLRTAIEQVNKTGEMGVEVKNMVETYMKEKDGVDLNTPVDMNEAVDQSVEALGAMSRDAKKK
jgi:hypothetical protein